MCRNGYPEGGEKVEKTFLFLLGSALGSPGPLQVTKMEPKDAKVLPRDPKPKVLGSKTASKMYNSLIDIRQIFASYASILGLEEQKPGNQYVHEKGNVVCERRRGGVGRSPLDNFLCWVTKSKIS